MTNKISRFRLLCYPSPRYSADYYDISIYQVFLIERKFHYNLKTNREKVIPSWLPISQRYQYQHLSVQGWTQISKCLVPFLCIPGIPEVISLNYEMRKEIRKWDCSYREPQALLHNVKTLHRGKFSCHTFLKIIFQYFCMWIIYTQSHQTIGLLKINLLWDYLNTILCIQWLTAHSVCDVLTWVSSA